MGVGGLAVKEERERCVFGCSVADLEASFCSTLQLDHLPSNSRDQCILPSKSIQNWPYLVLSLSSSMTTSSLLPAAERAETMLRRPSSRPSIRSCMVTRAMPAQLTVGSAALNVGEATLRVFKRQDRPTCCGGGGGASMSPFTTTPTTSCLSSRSSPQLPDHSTVANSPLTPPASHTETHHHGARLLLDAALRLLPLGRPREARHLLEHHCRQHGTDHGGTIRACEGAEWLDWILTACTGRGASDQAQDGRWAETANTSDIPEYVCTDLYKDTATLVRNMRSSRIHGIGTCSLTLDRSTQRAAKDTRRLRRLSGMLKRWDEYWRWSGRREPLEGSQEGLRDR